MGATGRREPFSIAVEGNIGSGKTEFAVRLAQHLRWTCVRENPCNHPFLQDFYNAPHLHALETEIVFVLMHRHALQRAAKTVTTGAGLVADFCLQKDPLFANLTLNEEERRVFDGVYEFAAKDTPLPDLLVYLRGTTQSLVSRIRQRARPMEQAIPESYLEALSAQYEGMVSSWPEDERIVFEMDDLDWSVRRDALDEAVGKVKAVADGLRKSA